MGALLGEMLSTARNRDIITEAEAGTLDRTFLAVLFSSYNPNNDTFRKPYIKIFESFINNFKVSQTRINKNINK